MFLIEIENLINDDKKTANIFIILIIISWLNWIEQFDCLNERKKCAEQADDSE